MYNLQQIFDVDELIKPRKEAAKKKMLEEIREEAVESAISKVTAAKQTQQAEAQEEEDESMYWHSWHDSYLGSTLGVSVVKVFKNDENCKNY